ncbi:serine protease persephone-like [Zerene cesonia]|uniref:serine protease persephone-like n=1 Tax=Zerene cesonia TaxID=33412 RepID=UPI0018E543D7|nr:serine protease persephone-like [Zerene cesonia]XP_038209892.1 serine protease persephone-like [Zerene cesonia]XP_038209893.1 serine protease persephone-like [Zerene cesonia]
MHHILSILFVFIIVSVAGDVGDLCRPNDKVSDGVCKLVTECFEAISAIQRRESHSFQRCGFSGLTEIVCCPSDRYTLIHKVTQKPVQTSTILTEEKFGASDKNNLRISDIECQKIVDSSLPPLGLHIIGGETASNGEFPHMAALGYDTVEGVKFQCGGSLISDQYILTAAHCVETLDDVKPSIVRLGVVDIGENSYNPDTDVNVSKIIVHPQYERKIKYNDIALLRLERRVSLSSNLNPVCLYTRDNDPKVPLTITGWGKTSTSRDTNSAQLLKANVTVVEASKCSALYGSWRRLPAGIARTQICAGDDQGRYDTCQGDSGGPLQALTSEDGQYRLIGVTSFGRGCASTVPGVYTRVASYLDWIEGIVWPQH